MGGQDASGVGDGGWALAMGLAIGTKSLPCNAIWCREALTGCPGQTPRPLKKTGFQRRIPATRAVKETEAQRLRITHMLTALKAGSANVAETLFPGSCVRFPYYDNSNTGR